MRKRLVSILMALCMAVSLLPVQALAADDAYTVGEDTRAKVRLYSGSLIPEENCATLTLPMGPSRYTSTQRSVCRWYWRIPVGNTWEAI